MVKISNILSENQESFEGLPEDLKLNDLVYIFKYTYFENVSKRGIVFNL